MSFTLENRSGYDTRDLRRFFAKGFRASGVTRPVHIVVVAAPARSRGCATVGGRRMVIAIASPARFRLRRFARLLEHEAAHLRGLEHGAMPEKLLYSLGGVPSWAEGSTFRYYGPAEDQIDRVGARRYPAPLLKNW